MAQGASCCKLKPSSARQKPLAAALVHLCSRAAPAQQDHEVAHYPSKSKWHEAGGDGGMACRPHLL